MLGRPSELVGAAGMGGWVGAVGGAIAPFFGLYLVFGNFFEIYFLLFTVAPLQKKLLLPTLIKTNHSVGADSIPNAYSNLAFPSIEKSSMSYRPVF